MQFRRLLTNVLILTAGLLPSYRAAAADGPEAERADTTITVDRVQVTAIKQGPVLRSTAVASSILGLRAVARGGITALKEISLTVPNFHAPDYGSRMTSSIYVRGNWPTSSASRCCGARSRRSTGATRWAAW